MAHILWVDNDLGQLSSFANNLRERGHEVQMARFASEAEAGLSTGHFDLLILDVMIPVTEGEDAKYPPEQTGLTHKTGLVFYRKWRDFLAAEHTPIMVFTVRVDKDIKDEFEVEGLASANFFTKGELRKWDDFYSTVQNLLRDGVAR